MTLLLLTYRTETSHKGWARGRYFTVKSSTR